MTIDALRQRPTTGTEEAAPPATGATKWLYVFLTVFCLLNMFPLLWLAVASLKSNTEIFSSILALPKEWNLDNYDRALSAGRLFQYGWNSVLVTTPTLVIVLLFGSMAAYVLAKVVPNAWLYNYFVLGIITPVHVLLIPIFILMRQVGLTNSLYSLIAVYSALNLPLAVFILTGFMRSIPDALEEAAFIDGASRLRVFFSIILPLSRPGLAVVGTLTFLGCWNEYLLALVLISSRDQKTLPQGIASLRGEFVTDYGILSAGLILSIIPVIVVYVLFQEQFIKGAVAGSTKG